jgi:hypothetical protein
MISHLAAPQNLFTEFENCGSDTLQGIERFDCGPHKLVQRTSRNASRREKLPYRAERYDLCSIVEDNLGTFAIQQFPH